MKTAPVLLPAALRWTCRRLNIRLTRFVLVVRVAPQQAWLFERRFSPGSSVRLVHGLTVTGAARLPRRQYVLRQRFVASTSRVGTGQRSGSNRTPLGLHCVAEKIGGGHPVGTVFKSRQPVGYTWLGIPDAPIAHRILWLGGLEPGFNQGGDVDSRARYIYIHGLGDEPSLGRPASRGCIHLAATDLIWLYDRLPVGTLVWIER